MKVYLIRGDTIDGEPSGFNNVLSIVLDKQRAEEIRDWYQTDSYQKKRYWGVGIDEWETE